MAEDFIKDVNYPLDRGGRATKQYPKGRPSFPVLEYQVEITGELVIEVGA